MEKNSTLNKKLKSYSALAGTLVAAGSANAQVMYTDVSPDATVNGASGAYNLDLDNNTVTDFTLLVATGSYGAYIYDYAIVSPSVTNNVVDTASTGGPMAHNLNDPINSTMLWDDPAATFELLALNLTSPFPYPYGNFLGATDKYIGFKFDIGGTVHYGWARIDVNATATAVTVKSYGYDATANTQILCGAMPTGLNNEELSNGTNIFGNANGINVNFLGNTNFQGFITVSDILGNVVAKTNVTNQNNLIALNSAVSGIYLVTVTNTEGVSFTKKLFVK